MDTKKLEIILRAIELGSLTKAAEEFYCSPSAVSQMVNAVENEIDTKIIKREYTGVKIADGKADIIELFKQMVEINNTILRTAATKSNTINTITIATYASLSKYVLPNAIKEYKKLCPNTHIQIIISDDLKQIHQSGKADVLLGEEVKAIECTWRRLFCDAYVAILPKSHICNTDYIKREILLQNAFIMAKDSKISNYIGKIVPKDTIINNSSDDSSVIELVKEGMYVSILPQLSLHSASGIQTKKLIPKLERVIGLTYNSADYSDKPYLNEFVNYLEKYIKNLSFINCTE